MLAATEHADRVTAADIDATADFNLAHRVHSLYKRLVNQKMLSEVDLSLSQGSALLFLMQSPEVSCQELAQLLGCGTSRISRLMHELEKRRLVESWRSPTDRRVLQFALTPEGAALACRVPSVLREAERQMLSVLTRRERRRLLELLGRIIVDVDCFRGIGEQTQVD